MGKHPASPTYALWGFQKENRKREETVFEDIMAQNFPYLKDMNLHIQEIQ